MRLALAMGATAGVGLALIGWGVFPPRPGLAAALGALRHPTVVSSRTDRWRAGLARPLTGLGLPGERSRRDLAVLERDPGDHLAAQAAAALLGLLAAPAAAILAAGHVSIAVPAAASLAGAAAGLSLVEARLRAAAAVARDELVHTLAALLDLVTVSLAGGAGVEQALADAAATARGPAAERIRAALSTAQLTRIPPWQTLGQLGTDIGVEDLQQLAACLSLAGTEGARVRASLSSRAQALRTRQTIAMQAAANAATERMALPLMLLGAAFMIFLLYPAIAAIGAAL